MELTKETKNNYKEAAIKASKWYVNNQNKKKFHADLGRYVWQVIDKKEPTYNGCWHEALAAVALNEIYKLTGEEVFKESVELSLAYLRSLQILDKHFLESYGAFRENSPVTPWSDVRDGATVAWVFLYFYRETGDKEYLRRAHLFGDWLIDYGSDEDGWPYGWVYFPGIKKVKNYNTQVEEQKKLQLNCQLGILPMYAELAKITGQVKFNERIDTMASYAMNNLRSSKGYFVSFDKEKNEKGHMSAMHILNDDFSTIGLLAAYKVTGKEKYLQAVFDYIAFIMDQLNEDGSFKRDNLKDLGGGEPVFANLLMEVQNYDQSKKYSSTVKKIMDKFMEKQAHSEDKLLDGGFEEVQYYEGKRKGPNISGRGTNYAIISLLKAAGISVKWLKPFLSE